MPTGSCVCGDFAYEFSDKPADLVVCHCLPCRKTSGTPGSFNLMVTPEHSFKVTRGISKQWVRKGDSGKDVKYHSCPICASVLFVEAEAAPGLRIVKLGPIDDEAYYASVGPPKGEIYCRNMAGWEKTWPGVEPKQGA